MVILHTVSDSLFFQKFSKNKIIKQLLQTSMIFLKNVYVYVCTCICMT